MKTVTVHEWNGMRVDVWRMNAGDKIERHSHPFVHSTGVARGSTKVTIWWPRWEDTVFPDVFIMQPGDKDLPFRPNMEHEIEALEDGTIIVNMQFPGLPGLPGLPGQKGNDGGIATDD